MADRLRERAGPALGYASKSAGRAISGWHLALRSESRLGGVVVLTASDPTHAAGHPRRPLSSPGRRPDTVTAGDNGPSDVGATVALAARTLSSAAGLVRVFDGNSWVGPVVTAAVAVHLVCWLMRKWRVPQPAALAVALACLWLVNIWTILGPTTRYGIPTGSTWAQFHDGLGEAQRDFTGSLAPVTATPGFLLLAAGGTGLVALLSDWITFRVKAVVWGAAPAFALFVVCCAAGQGPGRQWAVVLEVARLRRRFLLAQRAALGGGVRASGSPRNRRAECARLDDLASGGLAGGLALLTALLVTPTQRP